LAHHTEATEQEALELFELVDRPNVLIKIPGTEEGIPAIEHMLFRGVNVNITLLFSIDMYEAVVKAYIRAIEDRILRKMPVNHITSVASFFLSRIDVLVDQLLSQRITPAETVMNGIDITSLLGKAAVANAKMAYQKFKRYFSGAKWSDLTRKGARVQRLLWASTSTKNPEYSDVMYIEPLIGEDTVTTMPEQTLTAFADHGKVEADIIDQDVDRVSALFRDLNTVGIDMDFVTRQLVNEGIQKFIDPFDHLMQTIKNRRQKLVMAKNNDLIE
jgi:transaldolase